MQALPPAVYAIMLSVAPLGSKRVVASVRLLPVGVMLAPLASALVCLGHHGQRQGTDMSDLSSDVKPGPRVGLTRPPDGADSVGAGLCAPQSPPHRPRRHDRTAGGSQDFCSEP